MKYKLKIVNVMIKWFPESFYHISIWRFNSVEFQGDINTGLIIELKKRHFKAFKNEFDSKSLYYQRGIITVILT